MGTVYLVGAGPGDPGLITRRGARALRRADLVVHDALISPRLLELIPSSTPRIDVGKRAGGQRTPQAEINRILVEAARGARVVVRLKGGDPFVFGRGGEEALALRRAGVRFRVVPGVTSAVGVSAYAGIPLTHREISSSVTLVTGHEDVERSATRIDWERLAGIGGTVVVYMGVARLREVVEQLLRGGRAPETPAAVIAWGTYGHQRTVTAPLARLAERASAARLESPALVVVGEVVSLREELEWFEGRPLRGLRALVPRSRAQPSRLARAIVRAGGEVTEFPRLRAAAAADPGPLRRALGRLERYDWIVFTSPTAVARFWAELLSEGRDARACAGVRFAAFGATTGSALLSRGIRAEVTEPTFGAASAAGALDREGGLEGARILFPREDGAGSEITSRLRALGARVDEVEAYRQVVEPAGSEALRRELDRGSVDVVAFASSATVRHFVRVLGPCAGRAAVAAIGPATADTARAHGFDVRLVPPDPSLHSLVRGLRAFVPGTPDRPDAGRILPLAKGEPV